MRKILLAICLCTCLSPATSQGRPAEAHNIILMVADGLGLADVTATRIFQGGLHGAPLTFEQLPVVGYQRTSSADSVVTDSAAAASAWATGIKHKMGQISCGATSPTCSSPPPTILEIAKGLGKATGLVVTSSVTHATPAAFGAHVSSRLCEGEIGRQLIMDTGVDVLLGGGIGTNGKDLRSVGGQQRTTTEDELIFGSASPQQTIQQDVGPCQAYADTTVQATIDMAKAKNYAVVSTKEQLFSSAQQARQLLGLFGKGYKSMETFHLDGAQPYPVHEPTLAEMTDAALTTLGKDPEGFFLLVEGSQIDWHNHANDTPGMIAEVLGFDAAVAVVMKHLTARLVDPKTRQLSTLLIVTSDHETGGLAIIGPDNQQVPKGTIINTAWITKHHTGVDTMIWSQGPGSSELDRTVDNTDLFRVMKNAIAPYAIVKK